MQGDRSERGGGLGRAGCDRKEVVAWDGSGVGPAAADGQDEGGG